MTIDGWMETKCGIYVQKTIIHLKKKKKEIMTYERMWINLKAAMLREIG